MKQVCALRCCTARGYHDARGAAQQQPGNSCSTVQERVGGSTLYYVCYHLVLSASHLTPDSYRSLAMPQELSKERPRDVVHLSPADLSTRGRIHVQGCDAALRAANYKHLSPLCRMHVS